MLKRILLVVDGSKTGYIAQDLAINLTKEKKCLLTGVGVLDTPWITAAQPEPLGGTAYKLHRDDEIIKQSHNHVDFILNEFKCCSKKEHINYESVEVEGFPASEIEKISHEHDLVIIGQKTDFHFELEEESNLTVRQIARDSPRPLLIAPTTLADGNDDSVVVAYDNSSQSSRSLHMFLLLGLGEGKKVHIVTVQRGQNEADEIAMQALRMCAAHNVNALAHGVATSQDPGKAILAKTQELSAGLVVMGAFSHSTISEVLFGSCTHTLMKKSHVPLFIYH